MTNREKRKSKTSKFEIRNSNLIIRATSQEQKEVTRADDYNGALVNEVVRQMEGKAPIARAEIGGQQELTEEQRRKLPYVLAAQKPCVMCARAPHVVSWWRMPEQLARGRTDNVVFYALCWSCSVVPSVKLIVAQEFESRLSGKAKSPIILVA